MARKSRWTHQKYTPLLDKRPFLRMAEDVNQNTEEPVEVEKVEEEAKPLGAGKRKKKKDSLLPKRAPSGYILFR